MRACECRASLYPSGWDRFSCRFLTMEPAGGVTVPPGVPRLSYWLNKDSRKPKQEAILVDECAVVQDLSNFNPPPPKCSLHKKPRQSCGCPLGCPQFHCIRLGYHLTIPLICPKLFSISWAFVPSQWRLRKRPTIPAPKSILEVWFCRNKNNVWRKPNHNSREATEKMMHPPRNLTAQESLADNNASFLAVVFKCVCVCVCVCVFACLFFPKRTQLKKIPNTKLLLWTQNLKSFWKRKLAGEMLSNIWYLGFAVCYISSLGSQYLPLSSLLTKILYPRQDKRTLFCSSLKTHVTEKKLFWIKLFFVWVHFSFSLIELQWGDMKQLVPNWFVVNFFKNKSNKAGKFCVSLSCLINTKALKRTKSCTKWCKQGSMWQTSTWNKMNDSNETKEGKNTCSCWLFVRVKIQFSDELLLAFCHILVLSQIFKIRTVVPA